MNKRHYEHTLPNIRGSLSNTYQETESILLNTSELGKFFKRWQRVEDGR